MLEAGFQLGDVEMSFLVAGVWWLFFRWHRRNWKDKPLESKELPSLSEGLKTEERLPSDDR